MIRLPLKRHPAANNTPSVSRRRQAWLYARLMFALLLYLFLLSRLDYDALGALFTPVVVPAVLAAALLIIIQSAICTWRWCYLARARSDFVPSFAFSFWVYSENIFVNQFLPSTIGGDVLRVVRWQEAGVRGLPAAASVFADRLSGINGAALAVIAGAPLLSARKPLMRSNVLAAEGIGALVFACTAIGFLLLLWPKLFGILRRFDRLWQIAEGLRLNLTFERTFFYSVFVSFFGHVLSGISGYILAFALGLEIGFLPVMVTTCLSVLVSMIPVTLSGWGLREVTVIYFLAPLGVASHHAFALGLLFGVCNLIAALPGGLAIATGLSKPKTPQP